MIFIISLSLSMDAFSLSLAYGTNQINKKYQLSTMVGLFHFVMPLIGSLLGNIILNIIKIRPNIIVSIILSFIGLSMVFKKEEKVSPVKTLLEQILFSVAVSLDSLSVGIGLKAITNNIFLSSIIFSVTAGCITYLGLLLGNKISNKIGFISQTIGGIFLILIGIIYLLK